VLLPPLPLLLLALYSDWMSSYTCTVMAAPGVNEESMRARANRSSDPTSLIDTFWRYRGAVGAPLPFSLLRIDTYGATFCN
jgi:hypothetical protein